MAIFGTYPLLLSFISLITCCVNADLDNSRKFEKCDFKTDTCGWTVSEYGVPVGRDILVCGVLGRIGTCFLDFYFQDGGLWTRAQVQAIDFGGVSLDFREKFHKIKDGFVLSSLYFNDFQRRYMESDVVSPVIPLSVDHRCLRYSHLVWGYSALVVAYITDFYEPYDINHYLATHGNSSFINLSKYSVNLPVGVDFKLVFRSIHIANDSDDDHGLVLIDSISITEGLCGDCSPKEFRCNRNRDECIPTSKVCDLTFDCLDGEDEKDCDFEFVETICKLNMNSSVSRSSTQSPKEKAESGDCLLDRSDLSSDDVDDCCQNCLSNSSAISCPYSCTSSGFSFTCFSDNMPLFATSITVSGLVSDMLFFDESFMNLKQLSIINCTLQMLWIDSKCLIQTLIISNSSIQIADIDDESNSLRYVKFINCTFDEVKFSKKFQHVFNFFVKKSTVQNPGKIGQSLSVHVDLSESLGFQDMIERYRNVLVNLSFCHLNVQPESYQRTITLDLSHNNLSTWRYLSFIQNLHLQNNKIEAINFTSDLRQSEARLIDLDLSNNFITLVREFDFVNLPNILHLKLQNNRIVDVHENAFSFISRLRRLDLSFNLIHSLNQNHFRSLANLQYLYLQNNNIKVVEGMFDGLIRIRYLEVDSYTLCCAQPKTVNKIQCTAPVNEISSCNNLIDIPLLSTLIWYIALLAVFGNLFGPFYRGFKLKSKHLSSFVIFSINLSVADFLMGIYLYIIASANLTFTSRYGLEDEWWRHSPTCTIAGVLATLSSEASALFVLLITIDRIMIIRYPFSNLKRSGRVSKLVTFLVWIASLVLSLLPLFGSKYFNGYYSSSGICISLPLSVQRKPGWEYSMIIFVGANFVIFIAILLGQFIIFVDVVRIGKKSIAGHSIQRQREVNLAKTLIAVAVTDMLCWLPIGVIGLLTFAGIDVTAQVYAWVIVIVLPINSALNPIIYTFSEIIRRRGRRVRKPLQSVNKSPNSKEGTTSGEIFQITLSDEDRQSQT